jgi:hypothetical protein
MFKPLLKRIRFIKTFQSNYLSFSPILTQLTNLEKILNPRFNKV